MLDWMARTGRAVSRFYADSTARATQLSLAATATTPARPAEFYAMLRAYYANNGLYDLLQRSMYESGITHSALRGLRNPAFRVCEFYVASLWPGPLERALPIVVDDDANEAIVEPIQQVWAWSNWGAKKQVFSRTVPMLGDGFIKVVPDVGRGRVYFQLVDPEHVTEIDTDERGYLTYARIDVPIRVRAVDTPVARIHTEVWSKELGTFRRWVHAQPDRPIEELGAPVEETPLAAWGIDFVPIVHAKFRDVGEQRGVGAFTLSLDKIDEINRMATRLGQQLYRHVDATWAVTSTVIDREGRPLPALRPGPDGTVTGATTIRVGEGSFLSLPGGYDLKSLVPELDYAAMLNAIAQAVGDLGEDLPEMAYWRIPEVQGDASGRALRVKLLPAMARAEEARSNLEDALVRANQMALTIGQAAGLEVFRGIGSFDAGAFVHTFQERDVIPLSDLEKWQAEVQSWTAAKLQKDAGVTTDQILKERDYTEDEIAEMAQEREANQADLNAAMGDLMARQPGAAVPMTQNGGITMRTNGRQQAQEPGA